MKVLRCFNRFFDKMPVAKMVLEYVFLIHLHESVQTHSFTVMESHSVPFIMHYNATICTK